MDFKLLNETVINQVYEKYIKKDSKYFERFIDYKKYFTDDEYKKYKNIDPPRFISLIDFKQWINKYKLNIVDKMLITCSSDYELNYVKAKKCILASYPPHDLHTLNLEEKEFDFIIFNQTVEHLHTPIIAFNKLYSHLKPGGYLYTTMPTINIPHMVPNHYGGMTPIGLCSLGLSCNFQICECGYWGNLKYIEYIFSNNDWPGIEDILEDGKLTHNDTCQAQTWVLFKKATNE